jgi:hypothetical protein
MVKRCSYLWNKGVTHVEAVRSWATELAGSMNKLLLAGLLQAPPILIDELNASQRIAASIGLIQGSELVVELIGNIREAAELNNQEQQLNYSGLCLSYMKVESYREELLRRIERSSLNKW